MNKIWVSVGHDIKRKGAYCSYTDEYEYDILVDLTQYVWEELVELKLNSEKVYADKLHEAIDEINQKGSKNDLAIEMHLNSFSDPKVNGCEVEYYHTSERGKKLAKAVQDSYLAHLGLRNAHNDGRKDLGFLNKVKCVAIIPEPFFLSNKKEVERFLINNREDNLRNIAKATAIGVFAFLREEGNLEKFKV